MIIWPATTTIFVLSTAAATTTVTTATATSVVKKRIRNIAQLKLNWKFSYKYFI